MKRCLKHPEPPSLVSYRQAQPNSTWEQMKNDPHHGGMQTYRDVKRTLVRGQRCLCAYCEIRIADGTTDAAIEATIHRQRVEHFHPKSDLNSPPNWALHWPNLWAVCLGGSQVPPGGIPSDPNQYLPPLPENLSCDAFKDIQIQSGKLPASPEGWILAPDEIPAFPLLFQFAPDGTPEPHLLNCAGVVPLNNHHGDTATLVTETIKHLNLGCLRLNRSRCIVKAQMEKQIKQARELAPGANPQSVMLILVRRLFRQDPSSPWPPFFTLLRWHLGSHAETHLQAIQFAG